MGQSFLIEPRLAHEVASRAAGCLDVLEPGAGLGVVTARLSDVARRVNAVEVDARLLPVLRELADEHVNVDIVNADVLEYGVRRVDCVAGNPPYSITGPLISHIVVEIQPRRAVLTLQREVALRLAARPGSKAYGRITVLVQAVYDVELGGVYPPSAFYPPPDVYSQVVILEARRVLDKQLLRRLESLTRCLFSQRNRRADKVVRECCSVEVGSFGDKRVYQLTPDEILALLEGCVEVDVDTRGGRGD